jgi:6-phosphogluconolactonase (cycloisomerase 2 family)
MRTRSRIEGRSVPAMSKKSIVSGLTGNLLALLLFALASCTRPDVLTLFVGTYSDGFHAIEFNQADGTFVEEIAKAEMPNPSYLAVHGNKVYAVSEMPDDRASVWAWRWLGGGFEFINSQPTGLPAKGEDPCYVSTDGTVLAVANYSGGTLATYRLRDDGSIAPLDSLLISGTGGPDLSRQESPHVHCAVFSPDDKHLFFSEFSADEIGRLDVVGGRVRGYCRAATLHPDYGPRHLLFDASGEHLYVIGELSGDITVFDYAAGSLREKQVIKADRMDARGAADIHLSPDGKFLYASLRLRGDGIAVFEVGPGGVLAYTGFTATGPHPRNFNITPNGKWVLVACRDNDSVEVYARDRATGMLTPTDRRFSLERPVFVGW